MSRDEGRIGTGDEAAVDAAPILEEIALEIAVRPRPAAVARYLSASEGWKEASAELGGAFARRPPATDG